MSLGVYWDRVEIGRLDLAEESSRDYAFRYTDPSRQISLSLPSSRPAFTAAESRPFFEALLPEGTLREQIASQLRLASTDSYGLLAALGRDCAGALQIVAEKKMSETPGVRWLTQAQFDALIAELPSRPLGLPAGDERVRMSLAGVQQKAVLVRDVEGGFGEPLDGMPSTHIVKPDPGSDDTPDLPINEFFCMQLAAACELPTAKVELVATRAKRCLVVQRFDRDLESQPATRIHQEDLCQALGLTPDFKYQQADWLRPSHRSLGELLDRHSARPGVDRLTAALAATFNVVVGNADAHAKNVSVLYTSEGLRLAPLYDLVCTAAYERFTPRLAMSIGDVFDPGEIGVAQWMDLAADYGLQQRAFERARAALVTDMRERALELADRARAEGWHAQVVDRIVQTIEARAAQAL